MSAKAGYLFVLSLSALWACAARAEDPQPRLGMAQVVESTPMPAPETLPSAGSLPSPGTPPVGGLSSWITYSRPDCCGPIGGDGPITYEIYARTGPSVPVSGGLLNDALETGWTFEGGGRSLFFNTYQDAAWTVDLSLSYQYDHSNRPDLTFTELGKPVHISTLHRTFGNIALGREFYLLKAADGPGLNWRVGLDGGGRMGTARLEVYRNDVTPTNYERLADVIGGAFASLHTDIECPRGCCTYLAGFRAEWSYTWMDVLPQNSDLQDVNFLVTAGVRF